MNIGQRILSRVKGWFTHGKTFKPTEQHYNVAVPARSKPASERYHSIGVERLVNGYWMRHMRPEAGYDGSSRRGMVPLKPIRRVGGA